MAPGNVSPLVVWLGSAESRDVTGRVFEVAGGKISVADGWRAGPEIDKGARWDAGRDRRRKVLELRRQKAVAPAEGPRKLTHGFRDSTKSRGAAPTARGLSSTSHSGPRGDPRRR